MARYRSEESVYNKPWYGTWRSMMQRCFNEKSANYKYYGGRWITVCEEWKDPFVFGEWAEVNGYKKGVSIDRIDNNGNYEPCNCRFATKKEQANNRRSCVLITHNGETHNLTEWAEIVGVKQKVIVNRYFNGMRPPELFRKPIVCKGNTWTVTESGRRRWE